MNVASSRKRFSVIMGLLLSIAHTSYSMIYDNRYFPWLSHMYTSVNSKHGHLNLDGFFVTGGDAYRCEDRAKKEERIVSYPEIWGELDFGELGQAMTTAGLNNPIPTDWLWHNPGFTAKMNGSLEGHGIAIDGYVPICKHFGMGASAVLFNLNSYVTVSPSEDSVSKLFLDTPGNQAQFTKMLSDMYKELGITCTTVREFGPGDVIVYAKIYGLQEYKYKMRAIDWGALIGMIIPSGITRDINNIASVPFGGNNHWGLFIAPYVELELREDIKFGLQARYTQRFNRDMQLRVPIAKEHPLFAPVTSCTNIQPGATLTIAPYFAFEDLRAGFGLQAKYTITHHDRDTFSTVLPDIDAKPRFGQMTKKSRWTSEYLSFRLFYDVAHDKTWSKRPLISFEWDVPLNQVAGRGVAKTHRVSIGCTVNF